MNRGDAFKKVVAKLRLEFGEGPVEDLLALIDAQVALDKKWDDEKIILPLTDEEHAQFKADCKHRNILATKVKPEISLKLHKLLNEI